MTGWEQTDTKHSVSIQRDTPAVPADGKYHVLVDGEIVLSTSVEAAAIAEFEDVVEQRRAHSKELLRKELGDADYRSMRSASWSEKSGRDSRKGGRGVGRK